MPIAGLEASIPRCPTRAPYARGTPASLCAWRSRTSPAGQAGKGSSEQADAFQREPGKVASPLASLPAFLEHDAPSSPEPIFRLSCTLAPSLPPHRQPQRHRSTPSSPENVGVLLTVTDTSASRGFNGTCRLERGPPRRPASAKWPGTQG